MSKTSKLSSAFNVLWEAISIITNNWRSLLPIMLVNLLFSSLILLLNCLTITPTMTEFSGSIASLLIIDPKGPQYVDTLSTMRKDIKEIITIETIFFVADFIISSFITMTTIHLISMAYSDKKPTPQELFSIIKKSWKEPMLTQLFATIMNIAVSFLIFILIIAFIMISIGSIGYALAGVLLAILAILLNLYVVLICSLSIVVSVVEEGCYGLAAFERSMELTNGKRRTGILIMFVTVVGASIISIAYNFLVFYTSSNTFVRLVIDFCYVVMLVMITILIHAVNTVFYFECKSNRSGLLGMEGDLGYTSMFTDGHASIP